MDTCFEFNLDPTILHMGALQLRYYGLIFASMLYVGFLIWRVQMLRGGYAEDLADRFMLWGILAVLIGSRLGHCFFYDPERYLNDPIQILQFWKGGLASHGATIGLVVAMLIFSIKYKMRFLEVLDRFSMSSAVGAAAVRLGNFFNSEIVGRQTDLPWAVKFLRYDNNCRHPSQLYEFALGLFVLLSLYLADRFAGKEKRPLGMMAGLFLVLYFTGRFFVEFVKEYQTDLQQKEFLTMGQYLSIVPFTIGLGLLIWAFVKRIPTNEGQEERLARVTVQESAQKRTENSPAPKKPSRKNSKKKSKRK